ncbi:MAG: hypothetical protein U5L03_17075 [Burkholderiaceae bacterium]|nr:hypothetical protein [Burkholderiaceae bacterium]
MTKLTRAVPSATASLLLCLAASSAANEPRDTGNPCAAYLEDRHNYRPRTPAERQIAGRPFLYNGVDRIAAAPDRPISLAGEFSGPFRASCVIFEVRFADQGSRLAVVDATPRLIYPPVRSDAIAARYSAGEAVLRQIPFERVLRQKPSTQVPQLVAVPLWPAHPFYTGDPTRIAGPTVNELQPLGYGQAERIASSGDVAIYRISEQLQRNELVVRLVVLRNIVEQEPLLTLREVSTNSPAGPITRQVPDGAVGDIFSALIAPWMEQRALAHPMPVRQLRAEVRHYARGFRVPFDERNGEASVPFVVDPTTTRPTDHPLFITIHSKLIHPGGGATEWGHSAAPPAYANITELKQRLAEAHISKEERARRTQAKQAEVIAAEQRWAADQDAKQREARAQGSDANPLGALGYPNSRLLFKEGRTTYYLADLASPDGVLKIRPVVAVHDISANEPVLDFVDAGGGRVRYADARIAFVRARLVPAARERWPDLSRLDVHHHVRSMPLSDTAEYRRAGPRGYGFTFDQPVFEEQYAPDKSGTWRPTYEQDASRGRLVDLRLREYGRTVAEARTLRGTLDDDKRVAALTPAQRRAELTARRVAAAASRSPHYVYKSDRFWASLPRFYIAEQTFNGDFDKFQVNVQFPRHFLEFVHAYSRHCEAEIKAAGNYRHDVLTTQRVTIDGYGFERYRGLPETTHTYVPEALIPKFDEFSRVVSVASAAEAMSLFLNPNDMAAMGAKLLTTSPTQLVNSLVFDMPGSQGASGAILSNLLGLTYSWNQFFRSTNCRSATVYQMRENLLRAANGAASLQKAGLRVPNAAAESEPLAPPPGQRTVFDACYENHEYKKADLCICMDMRGAKVMTAAEKQKYLGDFQRFYDEIVFSTKSRADDPRWRLYELHKQCTR